MAKRYYDSFKFKDPWFRRLRPELKCTYDYLLCDCNHAGIMDIDIEDLNYRVAPKQPMTFEEIKKNFENKFVILAEETDKTGKITRMKVFIQRFIYWQYKNELTRTNQVHRSVISILKDEGINVLPYLKNKEELEE